MISKDTLPKILALVSAFCGTSAWAFPPAPFHEVYGIVRDEQGTPVADGTLIKLLGTGTTIISQPAAGALGFGTNYSLKVPMDAGTLGQLYQNSALQPTLPFTFEVEIGGVSYVPIEVQGSPMSIGDPGKRTRIDLTLGVDSDGDGLPDSWEREIMDALPEVNSLADIDRDGDADADGASNYLEYLAGTYAYDDRAVFEISIVDVTDDLARLRFLAVKGHSYQLSTTETLKEYAPLPFSLNADGSDPVLTLRADSIRFQDIYVPVSQLSRSFFQLNVQ